jgi:hypothetical protein
MHTGNTVLTSDWISNYKYYLAQGMMRQEWESRMQIYNYFASFYNIDVDEVILTLRMQNFWHDWATLYMPQQPFHRTPFSWAAQIAQSI